MHLSTATYAPVVLEPESQEFVEATSTPHRLVRELAVGTGAAVVFVEYDRSPEAH